MSKFHCSSCSASFASKSLRDTHSKKCVTTTTVTDIEGNKVKLTRHDDGKIYCYCSDKKCPKGYLTRDALQRHLNKVRGIWEGPEKRAMTPTNLTQAVSCTVRAVLVELTSAHVSQFQFKFNLLLKCRFQWVQ